MFRVCIISCGMIANEAHIPAYKRFSDTFEIVGVCDVNEVAAFETAKRHGICNWYTSAEEMLSYLKPDLVSVCVPNLLHKKYTMLALEHGANVLCEKPLALNGDEARQMFDCAKSNGKLLMACQSMRFTPDRLSAKKVVQSGELGRVCYAEVSRIRRRGIPTWGTFHINEISGGGALIDIGVHILDAALWLMDYPKPVSVTAVTQQNYASETGSLEGSGALSGKVHIARQFDPSEMDVEDFCSGIVRFSENRLLSFKVAWAANLKEANDIRLSYLNAGIELPECRLLKGEDIIEKFEPCENKYKYEKYPGHFYIIENLAKVLKGEAEAFVKVEETIRVAEIIDAIYKSASSGREVFF